MTRQMCRKICTTGYFVYFGLENGTDCFCGNSVENATYVSILECTKPCSGNILEFCGGASKMNIMKTQTKCEKERAHALALEATGMTGVFTPSCWTREDFDGVNIGAYTWKQTWGSVGTSWCVDLEGNQLNTTQTDICDPFYTGQCVNDLDAPDRMLYEAHFSDDYLSREKCLDACKSAFYRFAGVENGRDCYCGNDMQLYSWPVGGGPGPRMPDNVRIIPDIECNLPCSGNLNEECGGENKLNIFNMKSKCERERDDGIEYVLETGIYGFFYPACIESGEYQPSQFDASSGYSWCVDMNGDEVPGTSTQLPMMPEICSVYYTGQCVSNQNQTLPLVVSLGSMTRESCKIHCDSEDSTYYALGDGSDCYCGDEIETPHFLPFPMCNSPCDGDANEMCGGVEAFNLFSLKEKVNILPLV